MITNIFLGIITWILNILLSIFPTSSGFSSETITAFQTVGGYTTIINTIVPMNTLGQILGLVIAYEILLFTFRGVRFIIGYIPLIGGK